MTSEHTIKIVTIEYHAGPLAHEIETPAGTMLLKPGRYLVTDSTGAKWVFTEENLTAFRVKPENN